MGEAMSRHSSLRMLLNPALQLTAGFPPFGRSGVRS